MIEKWCCVLFDCHMYVFLLSFIVDVCTTLMEHLDTEGLFRKSGSVVRVKSLRVCHSYLTSLMKLCRLHYFTMAVLFGPCRVNWTRVRIVYPLLSRWTSLDF